MSVFGNLSRMVDFGNILDVTISGTATRYGPFNVDEVILDTTVRCYIKVGDNTVVATNPVTGRNDGNMAISPTGKVITRIPYGSYISVIGTSGTLNIVPVLK